ncbi:MAG: pilus assembly protein PilM [Gammaproteobacteria bacterium]|nr:pilus assembly protein PilM [Gammaproteobacteria bacterium]
MISFLRNKRAAGGSGKRIGRGHIGLEFAREKLHMVQLEKDPQDRIVVRARCSRSYDTDRDELLQSVRTLKPTLTQALKSGRFRGRSVISVLPNRLVRTMSITYEPDRDGDGDAAIAKAMQQRLPEPLENYVIDYLPVRSNTERGPRLSVVAVARREHVIDYLELLRGCGLDVEALEIGPAAIKRLVTAMADLIDPENVLVINFGESLTYLTMISGRRLLFDQEVEFGEQQLLTHIAASLDMDEVESRQLVYSHALNNDGPNGMTDGVTALAPDDIRETLLQIIRPRFVPLLEEIKRTLMYAAAETRGEAAKRIFLVGSIARWNAVDRLLSEMLDIQVLTIPDPLAPFCMTSDSTRTSGAEPEIAVATGLALRGMFEHG